MSARTEALRQWQKADSVDFALVEPILEIIESTEARDYARINNFDLPNAQGIRKMKAEVLEGGDSFNADYEIRARSGYRFHNSEIQTLQALNLKEPNPITLGVITQQNPNFIYTEGFLEYAISEGPQVQNSLLKSIIKNPNEAKKNFARLMELGLAHSFEAFSAQLHIVLLSLSSDPTVESEIKNRLVQWFSSQDNFRQFPLQEQKLWEVEIPFIDWKEPTFEGFLMIDAFLKFLRIMADNIEGIDKLLFRKQEAANMRYGKFRVSKCREILRD
jgi:hypothetical protein